MRDGGGGGGGRGAARGDAHGAQLGRPRAPPLDAKRSGPPRAGVRFRPRCRGSSSPPAERSSEEALGLRTAGERILVARSAPAAASSRQLRVRKALAELRSALPAVRTAATRKALRGAPDCS